MVSYGGSLEKASISQKLDQDSRAGRDFSQPRNKTFSQLCIIGTLSSSQSILSIKAGPPPTVSNRQGRKGRLAGPKFVTPHSCHYITHSFLPSFLPRSRSVEEEDQLSVSRIKPAILAQKVSKGVRKVGWAHESMGVTGDK